MPRLRNANTCVAAVEKALAWLEPRFGAADALSKLGLNACHKAPYLFAVSGRYEESHQFLRQVHDRFMTPDGVLFDLPAPLNNGPEAEGEDHEARAPAPASLTATAWVVAGAQSSARFGVACPAARFLRNRQGANTGGVYEMNAKKPECGLAATAAAGISFLCCGMIPEARAAGNLWTRAINAIKDENGALYLRYDAHARPIKKAAHTVKPSAPAQAYDALGMGLVFLSKLALAVPDDIYLDAARALFAFVEGCHDDVWTSQRSGPIAWGAAALYHDTRRRFYLEAAERVAQSLAEQQDKSGRWRLPGRNAAKREIDRAAELAICLIESLREAQ